MKHLNGIVASMFPVSRQQHLQRCRLLWDPHSASSHVFISHPGHWRGSLAWFARGMLQKLKQINIWKYMHTRSYLSKAPFADEFEVVKIWWFHSGEQNRHAGLHCDAQEFQVTTSHLFDVYCTNDFDVQSMKHKCPVGSSSIAGVRPQRVARISVPWRSQRFFEDS